MASPTRSSRSADPLKQRLHWPFLGAQSVLGVPLVFQDEEHAAIFTDFFAAAVDELDKVLASSGSAPAGTLRQWLMALSPEQQQQLILSLFSGPIPDFIQGAGRVLESHKSHYGEKNS